MGGGACVVIIEGNTVQGEAARLAQTAIASCQLVDYLDGDADIQFNEADSQQIQNFHLKAKITLKKMNAELDGINRSLAEKYSR